MTSKDLNVLCFKQAVFMAGVFYVLSLVVQVLMLCVPPVPSFSTIISHCESSLSYVLGSASQMLSAEGPKEQPVTLEYRGTVEQQLTEVNYCCCFSLSIFSHIVSL